MSTPMPAPSETVKQNGRGVLCAKCEHLNPLGLEKCETCQAALYAPCPQCGHRNPAVLDHCVECKRRQAPATPIESLESGPKGQGVLCAKCEHLNPLGIEKCEECKAALYAPCPKCGHRNPCVLDHCVECKRREAPAPRIETLESGPKGQGVLCAKCEHLNPQGLEKCETCQAALFAPCPKCGHRNPCVRDRCEKCYPRLALEQLPENSEAGPVGPGVLCVKCEHLNPPGVDKCTACDAHLFVFCSHCNHRNARVHSRCENCQRKLHRSVKERWNEGSDPRPVNLLYFALALAGLIVLGGLALWLSGIQLPRLW